MKRLNKISAEMSPSPALCRLMRRPSLFADLALSEEAFAANPSEESFEKLKAEVKKLEVLR